MYELALCAGIAGLSYGLQRAGIKAACYVEHNEYRINVLISRMQDGSLHNAPIWDDVKTFDGRAWRGCVDIISAGFPCQPFSRAGKKLKEEDPRHLWPDILRIIRDVRPRYIVLENVSDLLMGNERKQQPAPIATVLSELAQSGYDAEWQVLPASLFGAPHERERVFVVAYTSESRRGRILCGLSTICLEAFQGWETNTLDSPGATLQALEQRNGESALLRNYDGVPDGVERLSAIGEAVLPQIGEYIGRCIMASEE